ncbi:hypothetical protein Scep_021597 [Stephania cephalantha]|uniref:Uncharacterized protein n=1 Tax=Stephania cephalantha TaxID=152367 RepID=A0AAP0FBK1_9MAGN
MDGRSRTSRKQPHELRGKLAARWRMANRRVAAATREVAAVRQKVGAARELDSDAGELVDKWETTAAACFAVARLELRGEEMRCETMADRRRNSGNGRGLHERKEDRQTRDTATPARGGCGRKRRADEGCDASDNALSTGRMRDFDEIATTRRRAGRPGPRPKSDVFHGRLSILSGSMDGS